MSETRLEFNDDQGRRIVRVDKDVFTVGRRAGNDLQLLGNEISRDHAEFALVNGAWMLRDNDSRYGSFINGERVAKERSINHLDHIRFGTIDPELTFFVSAAGSVGRVTDVAVGDLRQIASLLEGLRAVGSSRVLDDVLALVLDSSIDISGAERGFIMLAGSDGRLEFKMGRARGRQTLDGTVFKTSRKIPDEVFFTGHARIVLDMLDGAMADTHGATIAMGIRNVLCVPLSLVHFMASAQDRAADERRIGVLYLDSQTKGTLDSPLTATALEALAREAAVAIENTRLYREALEKVRMEQDMRIAAEIQQGLLPERQRLGPFFEAVGAMIPCQAIGGDFFDYLDLPDGRIGFVLCDVSGKGAPAALMTAMIQGVFRGHAEDAQGPAAAMTRVNRVLANRAVKSRYATCFYGMLAPDGRFVFSNAGHNPPILVRRDGTSRRLDKGGMPLGLFGPAVYEEEELTLAAGDTLLLFSDGMSEAANPAEEEFGDDRLIESLCAERHLESDALLDSIFAQVKAFASTQAQGDDMTALIVRRRC